MESDFWINKWQKGEIGFHQESYNPYLVKYFNQLGDVKNIFVPLCGKSNDMLWLLDQGLQITGVELSTLAVESFFIDNKITYQIKNTGSFQCYHGENITIYCGNFFDLSATFIKSCDAIYDRASLIALPKEMRTQYIRHLENISNCLPTLLLSIEYDQKRVDGPPFSVDHEEIKNLYERRTIELLEKNPVERMPQKMIDAGVEIKQKIFLVR